MQEADDLADPDDMGFSSTQVMNRQDDEENEEGGARGKKGAKGRAGKKAKDKVRVEGCEGEGGRGCLTQQGSLQYLTEGPSARISRHRRCLQADQRAGCMCPPLVPV